MQLLERESALDALGGWFAEARAGRGRLVLVAGEAGVGKTTLVNEFALQHWQVARVLRGACDALTTPGRWARWPTSPPRSAVGSSSCSGTRHLGRHCSPPCSAGCWTLGFRMCW